MELRQYQREAVDAVFGAFQEHNSTLLIMATGCGKTAVFTKVAERFRPEGRVLVLAHREELLNQAAATIRQWTDMSVGIEQAERSTIAAPQPPDVTVASVQTLSQKRRLDHFRHDEFGLVVSDESHHATANTYQRILKHFNALHLGVTATPFRADGKALGAVFESVAYTYEIRDGIEHAYLCPITQQAIFVESLDLSQVRTTAGDLNEGDLEQIMREEKHLHAIAEPTIREAKDRPTLVFCTGVAHAHDLAEIFNRYKPGLAVALDGGIDRKARQQRLIDFKAGQFQFLLNCALFTEGFDEPSISCVVIARPTKSRVLYCQMAGRGTRIHPGKENLLILDFAGNAGKHNLITALDIFDGNTDTEVKLRAQQKLNDEPGTDLADALQEAADEIAQEARQRALLAARDQQMRAQYRAVKIDPFAVIGVHPRAGRWGGAPITDKQANMLLQAKIPIDGLDKGQASELIGRIIERRKSGLSTFRQAKVLVRAGLSPDVPFEVAGQQIAALENAHWRPSPERFSAIVRMAEGGA